MVETTLYRVTDVTGLSARVPGPPGAMESQGERLLVCASATGWILAKTGISDLPDPEFRRAYEDFERRHGRCDQWTVTPIDG